MPATMMHVNLSFKRDVHGPPPRYRTPSPPRAAIEPLSPIPVNDALPAPQQQKRRRRKSTRNGKTSKRVRDAEETESEEGATGRRRSKVSDSVQGAGHNRARGRSSTMEDLATLALQTSPRYSSSSFQGPPLGSFSPPVLVPTHPTGLAYPSPQASYSPYVQDDFSERPSKRARSSEVQGTNQYIHMSARPSTSYNPGDQAPNAWAAGTGPAPSNGLAITFDTDTNRMSEDAELLLNFAIARPNKMSNKNDRQTAESEQDLLSQKVMSPPKMAVQAEQVQHTSEPLSEITAVSEEIDKQVAGVNTSTQDQDLPEQTVIPLDASTSRPEEVLKASESSPMINSQDPLDNNSAKSAVEQQLADELQADAQPSHAVHHTGDTLATLEDKGTVITRENPLSTIQPTENEPSTTVGREAGSDERHSEKNNITQANTISNGESITEKANNEGRDTVPPPVSTVPVKRGRGNRGWPKGKPRGPRASWKNTSTSKAAEVPSETQHTPVQSSDEVIHHDIVSELPDVLAGVPVLQSTKPLTDEVTTETDKHSEAPPTSSELPNDKLELPHSPPERHADKASNDPPNETSHVENDPHARKFVEELQQASREEPDLNRTLISSNDPQGSELAHPPEDVEIGTQRPETLDTQISRSTALPSVHDNSSRLDSRVHGLDPPEPSDRVAQCARCNFSRNSLDGNLDTEATSWISCDGCKRWFHFACAGFKNEREVRSVDKFNCKDCRPKCGPTTFVRKSSRAHTAIDYAGLHQGVVKTSDESPEHHYIKPIKEGTIKFLAENFPRMAPELVTRDFFEKGNGMKEPIVIPAYLNPRPGIWQELDQQVAPSDNSGISQEYDYGLVQDDGQDCLDMVIPRGLTVRRVAELYGPEEKVEVIDVKSQEGEEKKWNMRKWADYYESKGEKIVRNVISLEVSQSKLGRLIRRPKVVRDLDLQDSVWPQDLQAKGDFPKVQFYCLMSVADCFTDFHIDFGGSSVFYHIARGKKTFFFIPPKNKHLKKYEEWCMSPAQNWTFLPDQTKECYRVDLSEGDTMLIPSGWIHAVWTPEDSLVIGGNFLTRLHYGMQIRIAELEKATKVARKFRYPYFQKVLWYTAVRYLEDDPTPQSVIQQLCSGEKFYREIPGYYEFDSWGSNAKPGRDNYQTRYYSQFELEGLPDLTRFLLRTALIALGKITDGITQDTRNAVARSLPKGHGEPLDVVKKFAWWSAWKRGNEEIPHWAYPDAVPGGGLPPASEKRSSVVSLRRSDRETPRRETPKGERHSARQQSQAEAVALRTSEVISAGSPPSSKRQNSITTMDEDEKPTRTMKTSVLGPKRSACDTCRLRRIRCKHKEELEASPRDNIQSPQAAIPAQVEVTGEPLVQDDQPRADSQPETMVQPETSASLVDIVDPVLSSDMVNGIPSPPLEPSTPAALTVPPLLTPQVNGVTSPPLEGSLSNTLNKITACEICQKSKVDHSNTTISQRTDPSQCQCIHDVSENTDPAKAQKQFTPRGFAKRQHPGDDENERSPKRPKEEPLAQSKELTENDVPTDNVEFRQTMSGTQSSLEEPNSAEAHDTAMTDIVNNPPDDDVAQSGDATIVKNGLHDHLGSGPEVADVPEQASPTAHAEGDMTTIPNETSSQTPPTMESKLASSTPNTPEMRLLPIQSGGVASNHQSKELFRHHEIQEQLEVEDSGKETVLSVSEVVDQSPADEEKEPPLVDQKEVDNPSASPLAAVDHPVAEAVDSQSGPAHSSEDAENTRDVLDERVFSKQHSYSETTISPQQMEVAETSEANINNYDAEPEQQSDGTTGRNGSSVEDSIPKEESLSPPESPLTELSSDFGSPPPELPVPRKTRRIAPTGPARHSGRQSKQIQRYSSEKYYRGHKTEETPEAEEEPEPQNEEVEPENEEVEPIVEKASTPRLKRRSLTAASGKIAKTYSRRHYRTQSLGHVKTKATPTKSGKQSARASGQQTAKPGRPRRSSTVDMTAEEEDEDMKLARELAGIEFGLRRRKA